MGSSAIRKTGKPNCQLLNVRCTSDEELKKKVLAYEVSINAGYEKIIESNLRQRVLGNTNPVKLGRCFEFLNRWYGFKHGGDRKSSEKLFNLIESEIPFTQKEFAESYTL